MDSIEFYNIDCNLNIDSEDLLEKVRAPYTVILLIHYFGFRQPCDVMQKIAASHTPLILIEDMSHEWLSDLVKPANLIDCQKHIKIYSLRKHLPIPEGGLVVFNGASKSIKINPVLRSYVVRRVGGLVLRWLFNILSLTIIKKAAFKLLQAAETQLKQKSTIHVSSRITQAILYSTDLYEISGKRRQNFSTLLSGMSKGVSVVKPFYRKLPDGVTPLGFPILCEQRENLKAFLQKRAVYTPVHWQLPEEINENQFPHLHKISQTILTLPIDQRYSTRNMQYILRCLREWEKGINA
jgi:dTDP-4-amino-4,6-dideoxygalactose transaminase